jgi:hypothetical protein
MSPNPIAPGDGTPIDRGTGFDCDGSQVNNAAQTDSVVGDLQFYAVQSRHNSEFSCSQNYIPEWLSGNRLVLENKNPDNWDEVYTQDGRYGILTWLGDGPTFDFSATFEGHGLDASTAYALIYAPDPWPQGPLPGSPSTVLGVGESDGSGELTISGNPNLGYDIPHPTGDTNYPTGGKIWLVLDADHDGTQMTGWNPTEYLFETHLIKYNDTDN